MNLGRTGATGTHRSCTATTGAAPNRRWVVTWEEVLYDSSTIAVTSPTTHSAIVYEADSSIDIQWRPNCFAGSATVGVLGPSSGTSTQFGACNAAATLDRTQVRFTYGP